MCKSSSMCLLMEYLSHSWLLFIGLGVLVQAGLRWKTLLPVFMRDVYEYGRQRNGRTSWSWLNPSLPKRWFTHFYMWGVLCNFSLLLYYTSHCLLHSQLPLLGPVIESILGDFVSSRCESLSQAHIEVLLVLTLVCLQVSRRLYECLFVSVFSDSKIGAFHYLLGNYFYSCVGLTALLHLKSADNSPSLAPTLRTALLQSSLHWYHLAAVLLFLWASTHQYHCHVILANLRTAKTKSQYALPKGDWFEFVSNPHYLAEILIYLFLSLCQSFTNPATPMWLVFLFTITLLTLSGRQSHQWYQEKFKDYPKSRKVLIPFVY